MKIALDDDLTKARRQIAAAVATLPWDGTLSGNGFSSDTPGAKLAVLEAVPLSEIKTQGEHWSWEKRLQPRGQWCVPLCESPSDYVLCIPVVNRVDLLEKAVRSVCGLLPHIAIIDQTEQGLDDRWEGRAGIYRCHRKPFEFSQMMNWCQRLAMLRGRGLLGFMHNDAECAPGVAEGVLDECRHAMHRGVRWGAAMTNYDSYCWFNMIAVRDTGCWDETFPWYVADVDYYERMKDAGWQKLTLSQARVEHHPSRTLNAMSPQEQAKVRAQHDAAMRKYERKWGSPSGEFWPRYAVPFNGKAPPIEW